MTGDEWHEWENIATTLALLEQMAPARRRGRALPALACGEQITLADGRAVAVEHLLGEEPVAVWALAALQPRLAALALRPAAGLIRDAGMQRMVEIQLRNGESYWRSEEQLLARGVVQVYGPPTAPWAHHPPDAVDEFWPPLIEQVEWVPCGELAHGDLVLGYRWTTDPRRPQAPYWAVVAAIHRLGLWPAVTLTVAPPAVGAVVGTLAEQG